MFILGFSRKSIAARRHWPRMKRAVLVACLCALPLLQPAAAPAGEFTPAETVAVIDAEAAAHNATSGWSIRLKTKTFYNSRTSYEFGNPDPPGQKPLSRLQFPMDSVWTGFEARKDMGRYSLGAEFLTSVGSQRAGTTQDSDWADAAPHPLEYYSETRTSLRPSFQINADADVQVADALGLPQDFELRPVVGMRWQRLSFKLMDGVQYYYPAGGGPTQSFPFGGYTVAFVQDWWLPFAGLKAGYTWRNAPLVRRLKLSAQFDAGPAFGRNEDRHRLRGDRNTTEHTTGWAWRASAGANVDLSDRLDLGVEVEHTRIETTGTHEWKERNNSLEWSHGVRAWSEQSALTLKLGYRF
ncbi:MAG: hypothetical protein AUJ49_07870 [Desulfovibrionaceae bacterium CG1_02_65_16]|nr:MAG: hypothetical protein AUJ49_07870 [Desulfovibrionaceae bacterium CG1_02_65_16]